MYDEYSEMTIEEIKSLSKELAEIKKLISVQNQLLRNNNLLLQKQVMLSTEKEQTKINMPNDWSPYIGKNLYLQCSHKKDAIFFSELFAKKIEGNMFISKAMSDSEFASEINRVVPGDVIFIDVTENIFSDKLETMLKDIYQEKCIKVSIGKGETARIISIDVPEVYFVVYSFSEEIVPKWICDNYTFVKL